MAGLRTLFVVTWITCCVGPGHVECQLTTLNYNTTTACYGTDSSAFLHAQCSPGSNIAIKSLNALAKLRATMCPSVSNVSTDTSRCCTPAEDDCNMRYQEHPENFFGLCMGRDECSPRVEWQGTVQFSECNTSLYMDNSNYMLMEYYCIPENQIIKIPNNETKQGKAVYMQNSNYPETDTSAGHVDTCSVVTSCKTELVITIIHLAFQKKEDGTCAQRLTISHDSNTTYLNCGDNSNYTMKELRTRGYIQIEMSTSQAENNWTMWLEFKASDSQYPVQLACGSEVLMERPLDPDCVTSATYSPSDDQTASQDVTPSSSADMTSFTSTVIPLSWTISTHIPPADATENGGVPIWAIVLVVVTVIIILAVVTCAVLKRWLRSSKVGQVKDQQSQIFGLSMENTPRGNDSTRVPATLLVKN